MEFLLSGGNLVFDGRLQWTLEVLCSGSQTAVAIWSDDAAKDGVKNGRTGCFIKWHSDQPPTTLNGAAGTLTTSTAAETTMFVTSRFDFG